MTEHVRVNTDYEIVVPAEMRQKLRILPGDRLAIDIRDGYAVVRPEGQDYVELLRGLHREIWEGVDPQDYLRQEREAWQK
ncbi:MAG TPA: AbrB/MazE/SpoVT family DNA-binding domain-containing protein [Thermomicrobiales bacterium]|jgi:AbrB family looped-hinge helix DNA binding protein